MKKINFGASSLDKLSLPFNLTLQPRDKIAVTVAGVAIGIFLILQLIIFPVIDRRDRLASEIKSKTVDLREIQELKKEYENLTRYTRDLESRLKNRAKGFTLFSFIDKLAGSSGIKGNIAYMKPSTSNLKNSSYSLSMVEMKITALTLEQLSTFVHGIEDDQQLVWVKRLSISKGDKNKSLLTSVLQVETFQP